jgi:hypothetical protein
MAESKKRPPITNAFGKVFRSIRRREKFLSPPTAELGNKVFDAMVVAAIAKCVDYNVAVNRARKHRDEQFVFVSGLRGICEDLIYLAYISKNLPNDKSKLMHHLMQRSLAEGVKTQAKFFKANNPFQIVVEYNKKDGQDPAIIARQNVRDIWAEHGSARKDGPTVREMADDIGLLHTYEYIYFAASNFVHFNPQPLLKMGWGPNEGPFAFSTANMSGYYKALSSFYGSILFIAYQSAFPGSFTTDCTKDVKVLLALIEEMYRWPEIVTFEELNMRTPVYLLTHAMRQAVPEEGKPEGGILAEIRNLGSRLGNAPGS